VGDAASVLGFEKFKEDIDRTNHVGTLPGCFAGCNRWIRKVHLLLSRLNPSGSDSPIARLLRRRNWAMFRPGQALAA
jgi:hypothetical protein